MTCKGMCVRYKAEKPINSSRYAKVEKDGLREESNVNVNIGQKRCQMCEVFIKWEGLWCPCCGYRLRTKPRNRKYKVKTNDFLKIKEDIPDEEIERRGRIVNSVMSDPSIPEDSKLQEIKNRLSLVVDVT